MFDRDPRGSACTTFARSSALTFAVLLAILAPGRADDVRARTTLAHPDLAYTVPDKPYVVLRAGPIEAVVVDKLSRRR